MLHITLGSARLVDPKVDPLGRDRVGYAEWMTDEELHEANRGCWILGRRADSERYALFSFQGKVVQAMEIEGIVDTAPSAPSPCRLDPPARASGLRRLRERPGPLQGRNPVGYYVAPVGRNTCACGCGQPVTNGHFLPGYDQKAIHVRIARVGTVRDFIDWFDANYRAS